MNITVAKSWSELNEWQLEEIIDLYLHDMDKNPRKAFEKMIIILFQKNKGFWHRFKLWRIIRQVPISTLSEFGEFLLTPPKLHKFPKIKSSFFNRKIRNIQLIKPADRLGDLTIKQFSYMDKYFHDWMSTKSDKMLRALCASIYRANIQFDEQNLPQIAEHTDKLSRKQRQVIGFTYMSCFHHIADSFPVIFPKPKKLEEGQEPPKKQPHKPFSEIILKIVMEYDEKGTLGNLHESNNTRIYEFMNVFTKIILDAQKREREHAKR